MDFDYTLFKQMLDNSSGNRNVAARFYDKAVKTTEVNERGLPVFKNVTYVEIRLKDNSTEIFNQPATAEKIKRFPREYALYKAAKSQIKEGTPLEQFAFLTAAETATCKDRGIFTVEALADLSEEQSAFLGLENEHEAAVVFVRNAKNNNSTAYFAKKEREYNSKIADYKEKLELISRENNMLKQKIASLNKSNKLS